ncbi:pyridine nucleotide-disulfide oxidoreductase [Acinetobacter sp. ANC 4779]|uniref:NAD(P)/FAD-dependent oxidoreductase n=1 Tax=Acinetobacter sp. ANC 4779 TaxID=2529848 RepID=UPI00103FA3BC|nr:FAD-dependent oxidoreductase [Acinetobacter sp. ANC 4779]TCB49549.1 pyridine nucleotide-disulfide oxidoreductase [Acinetobacter sp. ANC 4779]
MQKLKAVIIGASHAAAQLSVSLRQEGWQGDILMIGDEPYLPYHRPPLSKTFLSGDKNIQDLLIRSATFYQKQHIDFLHGHVVSIDREQKMLKLADGSQMSYDKLAICTGARVRKLDIEGSELKGVYYVRNAADIAAIQQHIQSAKHAVMIGGGYIGLETAASLRKKGIQVSLLETAPRILQRVTAPELSEFYTRLHQAQGVKIYNHITLECIVGRAQVEGVLCADDKMIAADLVVVGIGVQPNIEVAEAAGIEVDNGIIIDAYGRTNDPDIVAAGDCTSHFNSRYQCQLRLESVPNANEQAKVAAATLCGKSKPYNVLPWFWSDQYDIKLQIAGLNHGYDQLVIRGDLQNSNSFAVFYFKNKQLIAADCINRPLEFMISKKIIHDNIQIDPDHFADESIDLKQLTQ